MDSIQNIQKDLRFYLSRRLTRGWNVPDRVSVNLTLRCNLSCTMCTTCYDSPELSLEEIKDIIDQTRAWGVEVFNPLGGEPFMRADLEDILRYAVDKGFYVSITTNATLITKTRANMLARIPSDRLHCNISIDGDARSNDIIRGKGNYQRAMQGYHNIRQADQDTGNSKRKIIVNIILHRQNKDNFLEILREFTRLGFDGIQVLNLFRGPNAQEHQAHGLWFREEDFLLLETLCGQLVEEKKQGRLPIENSIEELGKIPKYYQEELQPLEAPCWAGWKELYINADGRAIMCDGKLDFLAGQFGSVRENSLQELWNSPVLQDRRKVVKTCSTPCVQTCYLREQSDSGRQLLQRTWKISKKHVHTRYFSSFRSWNRQPSSKLHIELSDVSPCDIEDASAPPARWKDLIKRCDQAPSAENWTKFRDSGQVNFGRGFLGRDTLHTLLQSLQQEKLAFSSVVVSSWRGEPLLHPEIEAILEYLCGKVEQGMFSALEIETSGEFLRPSIAQFASRPIPQRWIVDLDQGQGLGVELLQRYRGLETSIVLKQRAMMGVTPIMWQGQSWYTKAQFPIHIGSIPTEFSDRWWIQRREQNNFFADNQAQRELEELARIFATQLHQDIATHCRAASRSMYVSWDAKVTLCARDKQLQQVVGDANHRSLAEIWRSLEEYRQQSLVSGKPSGAFCRDCGLFMGPNAP